MRVLFVLLFVVSLGVVCARPAESEDLEAVLKGNRWIAYAPTGYYPNESPPVLPGPESLRADLAVLRAAGFTGLITYGSEPEAISSVAEALGFRAMMLGVWDPFNPAERAKAVRIVATHKDLIVALVVGNEGLLSGRYTADNLCKAMTEIGVATRKAVTTTEPVDILLSESKIADCSQLISVNAHPFYSNKKEPALAVQWTLEAWEAVRKQYPDKPLIFKEVGLPTSGDAGLSEEAQKEYYSRLAQTPVLFSYFEAFDATARFKDGVIEQSWGLWRSDRTPKAVISALPWRITK